VTLAKSTAVERDPKGYDGRVSTPDPGWPLRRIVLLPLILFVVVSAAVFTLAKLHLAKPAASAGGATKLGDSGRGQVSFRETCGGCHGTNAQGGVGPRLAGARITLSAAKAQIDNGGGIMPARLVSGQREEDVLAYLATIDAKEAKPAASLCRTTGDADVRDHVLIAAVTELDDARPARAVVRNL
jgi:mono/diheme cytochrome c family protein